MAMSAPPPRRRFAISDASSMDIGIFVKNGSVNDAAAEQAGKNDKSHDGKESEAHNSDKSHDRTNSEAEMGHLPTEHAGSQEAEMGHLPTEHAGSQEAEMGHLPAEHAGSQEAEMGHLPTEHVGSQEAEMGYLPADHGGSQEAEMEHLPTEHAGSQEAKMGHLPVAPTPIMADLSEVAEAAYIGENQSLREAEQAQMAINLMQPSVPDAKPVDDTHGGTAQTDDEVNARQWLLGELSMAETSKETQPAPPKHGSDFLSF